jgi:aryl-alcohol dehydrogenase-like predicted oxidoreductase
MQDTRASHVIVQCRPFGRSGRHVSEIGFGCGGYWGLPVFSEREAERVLRVALERGVTLLDTGPNYSGGNAEARLGRLCDGRYDGMLIATKVGSRLLPSGKVVRDFSPEGMELSLRDSLRRLRTDHVDLLQLHGPPPETLADDAVLGALDGFVARGMIAYKGASADGEVAAQVARSGSYDTLMTTFSVLDQGSRGTLRTASANGLAVLVKSPLAHHVFGRELYKVVSLAKLWQLLRVLKNYRHMLARGRRLQLDGVMPGWSSAQIALKFVLSEPAVSSAIVGTTRVDHLLENLQAASKGPLDVSALAAIEAVG